MQTKYAMHPISWPREVLLLGGGRWARVVAEVLCQLLPPNHGLTICSPKGASSLIIWARQKGMEGRVKILAERPTINAADPPAVLIVNAAHDHISSANWALAQGATVLVEKPMSINLAALLDLVDQPAARHRLHAAHVFRFANYLKTLRQRIAMAGPLRSLKVTWEDGLREVRYGETKHYDSSISILQDCLPHVVSILQALISDFAPSFAGPIDVEHGGARVRLPLYLGGIPCELVLARHAPKRVRRVQAQTDRGSITMDFTVEPGLIEHNGLKLTADPNWSSQRRPLASLLTAFLDAAGGASPDPRLSISTALEACRLMDACAEDYRNGVYRSLEHAWSLGEAGHPTVEYALTELLQRNEPLTSEALTMRLARVRDRLKVAGPKAFTNTLRACLSNAHSITGHTHNQLMYPRKGKNT